MNSYQGVFKRYEKKYLITIEQYEMLLRRLNEYAQPDAFGKHTICNIYYDTHDYSLIRASMEKPVYKEKLRLRSYGTPDSQATVFLELKKKYKGVVYKRRVPLAYADAQLYLSTGFLPDKTDQILQEIGWFMQFYHPVPKAFIAYDRVALVGIENPDLRITFDQEIRARETVLDLCRGSWGTPLLPPNTVLMEIKIPGVMPLWLCHLLSQMEIFPASFSKYGEYYKNYLALSQIPEGGRLHA